MGQILWYLFKTQYLFTSWQHVQKKLIGLLKLKRYGTNQLASWEKNYSSIWILMIQTSKQGWYWWYCPENGWVSTSGSFQSFLEVLILLWLIPTSHPKGAWRRKVGQPLTITYCKTVVLTKECPEIYSALVHHKLIVVQDGDYQANRCIGCKRGRSIVLSSTHGRKK